MNEILQTLLSWPSVAIVAMIILHKQIGQLTNRLINSESGKAKIGPIEIELGKLASAQKEQEDDITKLQFLVSHFVTKHELKHLKALNSDDPFPFKKDDSSSFFEKELRRLRDFDLIDGKKNKGVRSLFKEQGDIKVHFYITELGKTYLSLREKVETKNKQNNERVNI